MLLSLVVAQDGQLVTSLSQGGFSGVSECPGVLLEGKRSHCFRILSTRFRVFTSGECQYVSVEELRRIGSVINESPVPLFS